MGAGAALASLGGGIGGGKDSGSSSTISPYAWIAANIAKHIEKEVDPLRASFLKMLLQVVQQGGSAVGTPLANQATAASLEAGSQAQQSAANNLARSSGGTANPAIEAFLASMRQQSGMATAAIPTEIGQSLLGAVPGAVSSAQSGVAQMLGEAISGNTSTNYSGQNFNWLLQKNPSLGGVGGSGGNGGGGTGPVFS